MTQEKKKYMTEHEARLIVAKANDHSERMSDLTREAITPYLLNSDYALGIIDGVANTSYVSFMAGARAMYNLLSESNEQTD